MSVSVQKPDILNYCLQHSFKPVWMVLTDGPILLISQKYNSWNTHIH